MGLPSELKASLEEQYPGADLQFAEMHYDLHLKNADPTDDEYPLTKYPIITKNPYVLLIMNYRKETGDEYEKKSYVIHAHMMMRNVVFRDVYDLDKEYVDTKGIQWFVTHEIIGIFVLEVAAQYTYEVFVAPDEVERLRKAASQQFIPMDPKDRSIMEKYWNQRSDPTFWYHEYILKSGANFEWCNLEDGKYENDKSLSCLYPPIRLVAHFLATKIMAIIEDCNYAPTREQNIINMAQRVCAELGTGLELMDEICAEVAQNAIEKNQISGSEIDEIKGKIHDEVCSFLAEHNYSAERNKEQYDKHYQKETHDRFIQYIAGRLGEEAWQKAIEEAQSHRIREIAAQVAWAVPASIPRNSWPSRLLIG